MTNNEWIKQVEESLIAKHDLKNWLTNELQSDLEVDVSEDDMGRHHFYWADNYDGECRVDEIAEKIAMEYVEYEIGDIPPSVENAINAGVGMLAEKIYNDIYDECYDKAVDKLPNPNERND